MSNRVISVLATFSPDVEVYSIDEAFIKIPDNHISDLDSYCRQIVDQIYKWTGIPVKIGVAETKTLAKLAAERVKKEKISSHYKMLTDSRDISRVLSLTELNDIWGIGRRISKKLTAMGIKNAARLVEVDINTIRSKFNVMLARTIMELNGTPCFALEDVPQQQKNLCYSRSFGQPVSDYNSMLQSVIHYASSAAAKLRKKNLKAQSLTVYITTNFFKHTDKQYANSKTMSFPYACNSTHQINSFAKQCLEKIFAKGFRYKKSGVILNDLIDESIVQEDLFIAVDNSDQQVSAVIDKINNEFGKGSKKYASEGINNQKWIMKRDLLSKNYTTKWEELLSID